jgi:hypothetical protein
MHIDALDATAALAGIVERAVDELFDREIKIGVWPDVSRILAAEFKAKRRERAGRGPLDRAAASDRSGEVHVIDGPGCNQLFRGPVIEVQRCEQILRQSDLVHGGLKTLADQQGLGGMLQNDGVARQKRRNNGIDRCEIRIIPWRDYQHDPRRHALDHAPEARPFGGHHWRQRLVA